MVFNQKGWILLLLKIAAWFYSERDLSLRNTFRPKTIVIYSLISISKDVLVCCEAWSATWMWFVWFVLGENIQRNIWGLIISFRFRQNVPNRTAYLRQSKSYQIIFRVVSLFILFFFYAKLIIIYYYSNSFTRDLLFERLKQTPSTLLVVQVQAYNQPKISLHISHLSLFNQLAAWLIK